MVKGVRIVISMAKALRFKVENENLFLPAAVAAAWATVPAGHWSGGMVCGVSVVVWDTWRHVG